jgi:hypothetical protein
VSFVSDIFQLLGVSRLGHQIYHSRRVFDTLGSVAKRGFSERAVYPPKGCRLFRVSNGKDGSRCAFQFRGRKATQGLGDFVQ